MKHKRRETQPKPHVTQGADAPAKQPGGKGVVVLFVAVLLGLAVAAFANQWQLNTDAIAYLRIAQYYAEGKTQLMVSGYWGPLLSWLMVPWLKLGVAPLLAGRLVMMLSGAVFVAGSFMLLKRTQLQGAVLYAATAIIGCAAIRWSVEVISPDLLMSGLFLLAVSELFQNIWLGSRTAHVRTGIWWALAYLAKPVAFPLAFLVTVAVAMIHGVARTTSWRALVRATSITLAAFALLVLPWIALLSAKYGGFTFSTSGRINHAIVGPGNADNIGKYHPVVREFHAPDLGRVTMWEDPSRMKYPFWSPLESAANFQHQLGLIQRNAQTVAVVFKGMDQFWLGLLSLIGCCVLLPPWRESLARQRWCWVLAPLGLLGGIYLPVYVQPTDERYFYAAMPLLLTSALNVGLALTRTLVSKAPWARWLALFMVCASFGMVPMFGASFALMGSTNAETRVAKELADKIQVANVKGSIAGSGLVQLGGLPQRAGLYAAFFLGVPWHGDEVNATPERFLASGARLAVVPRGSGDSPSTLVQSLLANPSFRDLDSVLFKSADEAKAFPLRVFEINPK